MVDMNIRLPLLSAIFTIIVLCSASLCYSKDTHPHAIIDTKFGSIEIELLPEVAPNHVRNFIKLAESGFYNGTLFHRIIPGFMIQGGDPTTHGDDRSKYGTGGPGYMIPAEFNDQPHVRGAVSMARGQDPDSAGSQFFIVVQDSRYLDHQYTVFGRVVKGMEVADEIVSQPRDENDIPMERIAMKVTITDAMNTDQQGSKTSPSGGDHEQQ